MKPLGQALNFLPVADPCVANNHGPASCVLPTILCVRTAWEAPLELGGFQRPENGKLRDIEDLS